MNVRHKEKNVQRRHFIKQLNLLNVPNLSYIFFFFLLILKPQPVWVFIK